MTAEHHAPTPQQKRRAGTSARLRGALERLITAHVENSVKLTVAALAREAGVGRNAIYVNHRDVIADLLLAAPERQSTDTSRKNPAETDWRSAAGELKERMRILATENAQLLKRVLDAEQAAGRAENRQAKLEADLRALRSPVHLPAGAPDAKR